MAEGRGCRLPLAFLPDGVLALVLSFGTVSGLVAANQVCRGWVIHGNRVDLWTSLGKAFDVAMPVSLGPQAGARAGGMLGAGKQKRALRSGSNAKRTFLRSWATAVKTDRIKHDTTLSEAYTLFRMQDSVARLRGLLRRRWGITFRTASKTTNSSSSNNNRSAGRSRSSSSSNNNNNNNNRKNSEGGAPASPPPAAVVCSNFSSKEAKVNGGVSAADTWCEGGSVRWPFDVNHRHGIFEGNTLLNFAVRCGRKKCVEFILWRMRANTEIADYGGFTPLLNTAWRGDLPLLKQLLAAGARLDVEGVSRGVGPYCPLGWAERKNRPVTAAFLRSLSARETEGGGGGEGGGGEGGDGVKNTAELKGNDAADTDVRVDAP